MDGSRAAPGGASARVLAACRDADVELVRFLWADHDGVVRGKAAATRVLPERMAGGIGLTVAMQAMNMLDQLQPVPGMGPVGEVRLVPDPATFAVLPYAPGAAVMTCDMLDLDGAPWAACPRSFLTRAVGELAEAGFTAQAAFEPEFTLGRRVGGPDGVDRLEPVDDSLCFSGTGFGEAHDYAVELVRALNAQGLDVEQYYPELGPGQQELSIRHAPPVRAADRMVLYRETARGVARRQGLWASLAPKPLPDQAGNGAHVHVSLWDPAGERNLFSDGADPLALSDTGYHFVGGLLAHLPALLALTCGSVNSYRRLQPRTWSGAYTCFGPDNREAPVRVASPLRGREDASVNLEIKTVDATGNPYLALGAVLLAGLDGVRNKTDPGEPLTADPATLDDAERDRRGIARLPGTLGTALDALERDELLSAALGEVRRHAYLAVKRSDVAA
ncbi:MAG TPA: glutamine synthetase family protein, partial [Frankiaceae bacterium]|nr:glutamine synthetase family protein [Frankiaceae bacterium]